MISFAFQLGSARLVFSYGVRGPRVAGRGSRVANRGSCVAGGGWYRVASLYKYLRLFDRRVLLCLLIFMGSVESVEALRNSSIDQAHLLLFTTAAAITPPTAAAAPSFVGSLLLPPFPLAILLTRREVKRRARDVRFGARCTLVALVALGVIEVPLHQVRDCFLRSVEGCATDEVYGS